jgi:hypothetical protein
MKNHLSKLLVVTAATLLFATGAVFAQPQRAKKAATEFTAILAKVPPNVRKEFLESIYFIGGRLATAKIGDVKSALSPDDFNAIKQIVGWGTLGEDHEGYKCNKPGECIAASKFICDPSACKGSTEGVLLGDMLRGVPPAVRRQYLNSMRFSDGRFNGGDVKLLEGYVNKADIDRLR